MNGSGLSAMMIQAGDETEKIYDAIGNKDADTFNIPKLSNREPGVNLSQENNLKLKYSKSLRLLKPNTDYHLYLRVNQKSPVFLKSIKTASLSVIEAKGTNSYAFNFLAYKFKNTLGDSTLTISTRNAEPFYPSAPLFLWGDAFDYLNWNNTSTTNPSTFLFSYNGQSGIILEDDSTPVDSNFSNLRYVDAALDANGKSADNTLVYWFDSNTDLNVWPTISINNQAIAMDIKQFIHTCSTSTALDIKEFVETTILH